MKTIAVSRETYKKLAELKAEFDTPNMDDALERLLENYKQLLKRISLKRLLELNRKETRIDVKELIEERSRYGWPRNAY